MLHLLMVLFLILFNVNICFSRGSRCKHEEHIKEALNDDSNGYLHYRLDEIKKQYKFTKERHGKIKKKRGLLLDDEVGPDTNEYFEGILEIPIIIHVLYNLNIDININDIITNQRISSQIYRLNQDFLMLNKEIEDIPTDEGWDKLAANYSMIFKLNRVIRKETNISVFTDDNYYQIYYDETGGSDIIDNKHNINIWIINYQQYAAWTFSPGFEDYKDGIVSDYRIFGDITFDNKWKDTMHSTWNLGRTLTHEIGHWFNLEHIWGDQHIGTCIDNDDVNDTPNQFNTHSECPIYGTQQTISCGSNDMFMNFMDYVDDQCFMFFTKGQLEKSLSILDHNDGVRRELTQYKQYNNHRFVNHFYFRVLHDDGYYNTSICAETDIELDYVIYSEIDHDNMDIYCCVSTTDNQYVDVIVDIQPTFSMDIAKENGYHYCMETNLGTQHNPLYVCYKKGEFHDIDRIQEIDIFILDKEKVLREYDYIYSFEYNGYTLKYIKEMNGEYNHFVYLGYKRSKNENQIASFLF